MYHSKNALLIKSTSFNQASNEYHQIISIIMWVSI